MKLSDEEIARACRLLEAYEVATIPPEGTYVEAYSESYEAYIAELMDSYKAGTITVPKVPMGWQYYTRKSIAAALIAALLAGIAMPEKVMAGYRWLINVVEEFLEDRTRYRYTSNVDEDVEFVPMQFGYLPEGMKETYREEKDTRITVLFEMWSENEYFYFDITQRLIYSENKIVYGSNTEIYYTDVILLNDNEGVKIIDYSDYISFNWMHDSYQIKGQTNLSTEELIKILENLNFN